jgi:hypothetical protein
MERCGDTVAYLTSTVQLAISSDKNAPKAVVGT